LRAEVEDTYDRLYTQTLRIAAGVPLPGG